MVGKCPSGKFSEWDFVIVGKCRGGIVSEWENVVWDNVVWEDVEWDNVMVGNCRVGKCHGIVLLALTYIKKIKRNVPLLKRYK